MGTPVKLPAPDIKEKLLERAHFLFLKRHYPEALKILTELHREYPADEEIERLRARIAHRIAEQREAISRRRDLRYYCGMNTSWRRFVWFVVGVCLLCYALYMGADRAQMAFQQGITAPITTMVRSDDMPGKTVPYTRPLYVDIGYYAAMLGIGASSLLLLWYVSRGSADWENLDETSASSSPGYTSSVDFLP